MTTTTESVVLSTVSSNVTTVVVGTTTEMTTENSNTTTDDDDDLIIGLACGGGVLLLLILLLMIQIVCKRKHGSRKTKKTVPIMIKGMSVSKTLTTRDRQSHHVSYLEAPTDSIHPSTRHKQKNKNSVSLALNALDKTTKSTAKNEQQQNKNLSIKFSTRIPKQESFSSSVALRSLELKS
jgi:hypothetical protein